MGSETNLIELEMSGFQAFKAPCKIPIAPITLIYGPNSAGKSSIHDALALIARIFAIRDLGTLGANWPFHDSDSRCLSLAPDWHREANDQFGEGPLRLSVTFTCPLYRAFNAQLCTERYLSFELLNSNRISPLKIKATVVFSGAWPAIKSGIFFDIDDVPLYRLEEGRNVGINTLHPVFGSEGMSLPKASSAVAATSPVVLSAWAEIHGDIAMSGPLQLDWALLAKRLNPKEKNLGDPRGFYEQLMEFSHVHNLLVEQLAEVTREACSVDLVEASRRIPKSDELTFVFTANCKDADASSLNFQLNSDMAYAEVARSAAALALNARSSKRAKKSLADGGVLASNVNQSLSDHLYTERGYRLDASLTELKPDQDASRANSRLPGWLVHLCLRDAVGRRLAFTEVGSGIGYVLPALVAFCRSRQVFVQQPELHLHPALQASLGDALIEAARNGRRLLVETHSEHLLLRILKRIRQTNTDAARAGNYTLGPQDVSLVYCEPETDGTSKAFVIGLTGKGEFIGRWPRGFFAERDAELYDE